MNFGKAIVKPPRIVERNDKRRGTVKYLDGIFYVKLHDGSLILIDKASIDITGVKVLYSLPENTSYCEWTPKRYDKTVSTFDRHSAGHKVIMRYWSKYKDGDIVHGDIYEVDDVKYFKIIDK